jgi:Cytochrome c7 and related cytochrome c
MAAPFPRWSNTASRVLVIVVLAGAALGVLAPMVYARTPWRRRQYDPPDQPVQFDHRHHVQDDGVSCIYCHSTVTRAATAGIPSTDKCMGCHSQIWSQSPMLEPVRRAYFSGMPIPWNRVHNLPDFVYFDHSIHVNKGVGCASCHGRVDRMAAVYQVRSLTMGWCLECHRHPEASLRPLDQITNMDWDAGDRQEELGRRLKAELGVKNLTNCTACHR